MSVSVAYSGKQLTTAGDANLSLDRGSASYRFPTSARWMALMARPLMRYFMARVLYIRDERDWIGVTLPIVTALTLPRALSVIPIRAAERRLSRSSESD